MSTSDLENGGADVSGSALAAPVQTKPVFRCHKCCVVDAIGCERSDCPNRPELQPAPDAELRCLSCTWQGMESETVMFGKISMLCPECGASTNAADHDAKALAALGAAAIACADSNPALCAGIVARLVPEHIGVLGAHVAAGNVFPHTAPPSAPVRSCACGANAWRDYYTGPVKTHDICAACGSRRWPLAASAIQPSDDDLHVVLLPCYDRQSPIQTTIQQLRKLFREAPGHAARWLDVASPPADHTMVLLELELELEIESPDGNVWPGYRDGDIWRDSSGMPLEDGSVTGWMHMPAARKKGGAG